MSKTEKNFLKEWFSDSNGYVEFHFIGQYGIEGQHFFEVEEVTEALLYELIEIGKSQQLDVYFGVATRSCKSGTEDDVFDIPGFWLAIDQKNATFEEALLVVKTLPTLPTAIVSSEEGACVYFKFNEPTIVVDNESFKFIKEWILKLDTFAKADLARLLQVPNNMYMKNLMDVKLCSLAEFTGATYSLDSFTHSNDPYHLDDFRYLYDLDYLYDLYDLEIQPVGKSSEKIGIKWLSPIEIDALKVPFYIKSLIVNGPQDWENRSKKLFHVVIELLKAQHTPEEIAFVLLKEEWAIGGEISNRHKGAKLKLIEGVINSVTQELKIEQANMELEKLMEVFDSNGWFVFEHNNGYYENQFSSLYLKKGDNQIQMNISKVRS